MKKFLFLILLSFLLCSCNSLNTLDSDEYATVEVVKSADSRSFHGVVKSQLITDLSFQSEGRIIFIPYTKGDYVKKGQVLARLDGILYKIRKDEEKARLNEAQIQYNKSKSYYKRMDILHKEGAISDNDWEEAYFALKTNSEQIRIQKEKINYLDKEISYNIIVAPYDGYISDKYTQVGAYAKIAEPILTIIGSNQTQIEFMVDSNMINKINLNDEVIAKRGDTIYRGKIKHISATSLNSGGYLVKVYLSEFVSELKDGMNVDIVVPTHDLYRASVPLNSIFEQNHEKYVYKVVNLKGNIGEIKKEQVRTGQIQDENIEIISGLKKDDIVIKSNLDKFRDKKLVKIKNKP